jgi:hypothetical protein
VGNTLLITMLSLWPSKWLLEADRNFYERGMQALVQRWRKCVQSDGEYVGK